MNITILTDVVALATLAVAAVAYLHGDISGGSLVLTALAGFYFGHRSSNPPPGSSGGGAQPQP